MLCFHGIRYSSRTLRTGTRMRLRIRTSAVRGNVDAHTYQRRHTDPARERPPLHSYAFLKRTSQPHFRLNGVPTLPHIPAQARRPIRAPPLTPHRIANRSPAGAGSSTLFTISRPHSWPRTPSLACAASCNTVCAKCAAIQRTVPVVKRFSPVQSKTRRSSLHPWTTKDSPSSLDGIDHG